MTPWAELLRNLGLRTSDGARAMRVPLWAIRLTLEDEPLDVTFDNAASHGIDAEALVADDRSECRRLAGALRAGGVTSFIAPSAALPGTENIVVLDAAAVIDFHQEPIDAGDWPVAMTSQDGRAPEGLWQLVHFIGAGVMHPALRAFLDGDAFQFEQPPVTAATPLAKLASS